MDKLNKILDQIITPDIDQVIQSQELVGCRLSGGIDSAFMTFLLMSKYPNKKLLPITMYNKLRPAAMDAVENVVNALRILNPENLPLSQSTQWL